MKKIVSLLLLITIFGKITFSQSYFFDNYGVKDGLAQSKVYQVSQDREGYLWLGTESGISRFDGVSFRNFTAEDGFFENGVRAVCHTANGATWTGHTGGGISRWKDGKLLIIKPEAWGIKGDITSLLATREGQLWVGTHGSGAFLLENPEADSADFVVRQFAGQERLSDLVFNLYQTRSGEVLFVIDKFVKRYIPEQQTFERIGVGILPEFFQITSLLEDDRGDFWFGTYNDGLYHWDKNKDEITFYDQVKSGLSHNFVSCLSQDPQGNIWAGTWGGGISVLDRQSDEIRIFNATNGLKDNKIWSITPDREGNMLVGTNENGLMIFKGLAFLSYLPQNGLPDPQVLAIEQDGQGRIWLGTNDGIALIDSAFMGPRRPSLLREGLANSRVRFLKKDRNGAIWVGTDMGVQNYDSQKDKFYYNFLVNSRFPNGNTLVTALEVDSGNNLWVGTIAGLIYYEIDQDKVAFLSQIDGLAGNDISALFADQQGRIWVGARGAGLSLIEGEQIRALDLGANFTPTAIAQDSSGRMWIGTEGQGIFVLDSELKVERRLRLSDGLLADLITVLGTDKQGNMYIGSNRGLNLLRWSDQKLLTFTERTGFTGIEVKNNAFCLDGQGMAWLGTVNGAIRHNPFLSSENQLEPLTHIMDFTVNFKATALTQGLRLNYDQNSISFTFSSICLTDPSAVRYRIRLKGIDEEWRPPTDQTFVSFPSLPPNSYTFEVVACNNSGLWNSEPVSFHFTIAPPFYRTWLFYLIVLSLVAAAIVSYIKIREASLKRENLVLEEKVRERTAEVTQKNIQLAQINHDLLDSIRYAKRIQDAVLPEGAVMDQSLAEYFIFFRPRDIVSGDFYWMTQRDGKIYITAADCTGHGVPGAFMSMLGVSFLNEIVNGGKAEQAAEILEQLKQDVIRSLKQKGQEGEAQDGMDMSFCVIDRQAMRLQFAGAYNPLYFVRDGKLETIKADRMPIGIYMKKGAKTFTNHEIELQHGDCFYMFSDGFHDQFGGDDGRKLMNKNFRNIILEASALPMSQQKAFLGAKLEEWMGDHQQVDDILIIGIKV